MKAEGAPSVVRALRRGGVSATTLLLAANVVVFILWQIAGPRAEWMFDLFTCSADGVLQHGRVWTLVTAAFSHFDFWHLLFNLFCFWMVARELEAMIGPRDLVALYVVSAAVASGGHVAAMEIAGTPQIPALGASGAVMASMVLFACFFPRRTFLIWGLLPIQARWLVLLYVGLDLAGALQSVNTSRVAHAAHLGGALVGFLWWKIPIRIFTGRRNRAARDAAWRAPSPPERGPYAPRETSTTVDSRRLHEIAQKVTRVRIAGL